MQKIQMLQCQCIIYQNTVKIRKKTTGSLWNYYSDEPSNPFSSNSESFKYKTSITGITYNAGDRKKGIMKTKFVKMKLKLLFH